ncbi:hypothetical protein EI94DRAFT_1709528 [Lactarius quietus]|nr:hypothetical protein EI94DRAFT_1709528 [Lactarius quietus]
MAELDNIDFSDIEENAEVEQDIHDRYKVRLEEGFDHILVVNCVPIIDKSKRDSLLTNIAKEFTRKGAAINPTIFPCHGTTRLERATGKKSPPSSIYAVVFERCHRYAFIEFRNADAATHALNELNGHPFDAKHTILVNHFTDIENFAILDETYVDPGRVPHQVPFTSLASSSSRPRSANIRTELYISWSPLGTYIAALYRQGIRLYGGPSFQLQASFFHPFVRLIDFSPCEQYHVTWSHEPFVVTEDMPKGPRLFSAEDESNNIAIWRIKTGHLLRPFPSILPEGESARKQNAWPALKWSPDDKCAARLTPGQRISVYKLPSIGLQGKKSIKIEGVVDFEWCPHGAKDPSKKPTENMLAYWTP